jgi:CHAD domain-containing protein
LAKHEAKNGQGKPGVDRPADVSLAMAGAAVLRQQFDAMRAHEAGTRLGEDVEELHQMRVATRRLREAMRVFVAKEARATFEPFGGTVREIAAALGAVRDLDVFRDELRARAEAAPDDRCAIGVLLDALESVRAKRRAELLAVLEATKAKVFWEEFPAAVSAFEASADPVETVRQAAPKLLRRRRKIALRSADNVQFPTSSELHDSRIQFKRLRYSGEFFEPWLERRVAPVIKIATQLQDTLGSLHDCDVRADLLEALVHDAPNDGASNGARGLELTRVTLALIQDTRQRRDELLIGFRDQLAELRAL